jgi:hypothetical protein
MRKLGIALGLLILASSGALAAVTGNNFVSPQTPNRGLVQFTQGIDTAGTFKTLYTAGANGSRCYGEWVSNNDSTTTHAVQTQIQSGAFSYVATSVTTSLSSGYSSGPISLMSSTAWPGLPVDQYGNPYIQLASGDLLRVTFLTALSAGAQLNVGITCSDF